MSDAVIRPAAIAPLAVLFAALAVHGCRGREAGPDAPDYPIRPVSFTQVTLSDDFWAPRLERNRTVSIPFAFRMNEETGRVDNFRKAARLMSGPHKGRRFNDTDVYKAMEAAAYALRLHPDPVLERTLDDLIAIIAQAQEPDGYLYTTRTNDPANPAPGAGPERWSNLRVSHELYNAGHMYEAAVAHFQATGRDDFLEIAVKNAELLLRTFGRGPGLRRGFPGHQEIEIGLAKLYRATGRRDYLDLAEFFLAERGHYFGGEKHAPDDPFSVYDSDEYLQNHKPVLEQNEAVGHAVRAMYMYAGMADVAALGARPEYAAALGRLWNDIVGRKMYLTGGVGARHTSEAFGGAYELPNAAAYTETCAAIGHALWNHRLFLLHGEARYMDVFERVLYNGLISGGSLSGDRFFYQNPLESAGDYERSPWFEVACCPPNLTRFLPSLPGYVYAVDGDVIYINLYIAGRAELEASGRRIALTQTTSYPWDGTVRISVEPLQAGPFELALRIPGWARNQAVPTDLYRFLEDSDQAPSLVVNGEVFPLDLRSGYARIRRTWTADDEVSLVLPMPVRRVLSHEAVTGNSDRVALQRGPIVFCVEGVDNDSRVFDLYLPDDAPLVAEFRPDLLDGVVAVSGDTLLAAKGPSGKMPGGPRSLRAIPYYAWANRGGTGMLVWLPRTASAVRPPVRIDRTVD